VARKIAIALGGTLELENDGAWEGTVFRLALPVPESEQHGLAATG
jgi:signal transduction histidine kinase